jgi:hypothetical protein
MNAGFYETVLNRSCLERSPLPAKRRLMSALQPIAVGSRSQTQLHQLKRRLLCQALEQTPSATAFKRLCGAANQAASLAWATNEPLLAFPCLFEELVQEMKMPAAFLAE